MHIADAPRTPTTRRGFIALGVGALAVAAVPVLGRARLRLWRRTLPVMGTLAEIAVEERDPRRAQAALDAAFAELVAVERAMTRRTKLLWIESPRFTSLRNTASD